jgi:hypothetical protein
MIDFVAVATAESRIGELQTTPTHRPLVCQGTSSTLIHSHVVVVHSNHQYAAYFPHTRNTHQLQACKSHSGFLPSGVLLQTTQQSHSAANCVCYTHPTHSQCAEHKISQLARLLTGCETPPAQSWTCCGPPCRDGIQVFWVTHVCWPSIVSSGLTPCTPSSISSAQSMRVCCASRAPSTRGSKCSATHPHCLGRPSSSLRFKDITIYEPPVCITNPMQHHDSMQEASTHCVLFSAHELWTIPCSQQCID